MVKKSTTQKAKVTTLHTAKKRARRSFVPEKFVQPKVVGFKGDGHKEVGITEPIWPAAEVQEGWTRIHRDLEVAHAFNWYNYTQTDKNAEAWMEEALSAGGNRPKLYPQIKKSDARIGKTIAWLMRMAQMGLILSWGEKKFIATRLQKLLAGVPKIEKASKEDEAETEKVNIQDRINAKLKITFGELDAAFDDFIKSNMSKKAEVMGIFARTAPPGNRMKDIIAYAEKHLRELNFAVTGVPPFDEAYNAYGKRSLKAMIGFWDAVVSAANSYGVIKRKNRKPRKAKVVSPEKMVSKLKHLKTFVPLKLTSIDPTQILRSTEVYTFNTKTRKLGIYVVDSHANAFDVKGSKILNMNPVLSVQKTLRKPEKQLPEFMALGKPASTKWMKAVKSTEIKMKESLSKDCIILKAYK